MSREAEDLPLARSRRATRWRRVVAGGLIVVCLGGPLFAEAAVHRADGGAVLILITDVLPARDPGAAVRRDEVRADSLLLVQWERGCDRLTVTSIPATFVLEPGADTLSILLQTKGLAAIVDQIDDAFLVRIAATVMLDVGEVEAMARRIGPVTIDLAAAARDQRTGFVGGPGPVALDGDLLIAFLRARTWEEFRGQEWQLVTVSDEERIDRLQTYLRAAVPVVERASVVDHVGLLVTLAANSDLDVIDPLVAAGFALGAASVRMTTFQVAPVLDERPLDDRSSPFAPADLEAAHRVVLSPDPFSPVRDVTCHDGPPASDRRVRQLPASRGNAVLGPGRPRAGTAGGRPHRFARRRGLRRRWHDRRQHGGLGHESSADAARRRPRLPRQQVHRLRAGGQPPTRRGPHRRRAGGAPPAGGRHDRLLPDSGPESGGGGGPLDDQACLRPRGRRRRGVGARDPGARVGCRRRRCAAQRRPRPRRSVGGPGRARDVASRPGRDRAVTGLPA